VKIVVIGGTGLIGSSLVTNLAHLGHEVIAAAPNTGVNTITGEGLAEALAGADIVVDVANSPVFDAAPALDFFLTSGRNLLAAGRPPGSSTTWPCRWSAPSGCRTAAISAPSWSRKR
jgi:uncharacterized protein YbjT (DUF2867 family)